VHSVLGSLKFALPETSAGSDGILQSKGKIGKVVRKSASLVRRHRRRRSRSLPFNDQRDQFQATFGIDAIWEFQKSRRGV
jgi:hypothetical protein